MQDPLEIWSFLLYVIGFLILCCIFYFFEPNLVHIQDISEHQGPFKIEGRVSKITETEKIAFLKISQECSIDAVLFKGRRNLSYLEGQNIVAIGNTGEFDGKKQYILNEIR